MGNEAARRVSIGLIVLHEMHPHLSLVLFGCNYSRDYAATVRAQPNLGLSRWELL